MNCAECNYSIISDGGFVVGCSRNEPCEYDDTPRILGERYDEYFGLDEWDEYDPFGE